MQISSNNIPSLNKKLSLILLCILCLVGGVFRYASSFWGYPNLLHPDEYAIVDSVFEMRTRHSFEPAIYARPDHFEIKANVIIFEVVSRLKFGQGLLDTFVDNRSFYYLIARFFTATLGWMMIPLSYLISELLARKSGIYTAFLFTAFPLYILNSGYATPDIPLSFFVLLFIYLLLSFTQKPVPGKLIAVCLAIVLGILVKYPMAISLAVLLAAFIAVALRDKSWKRMIKFALFSGLVMIALAFILAPNLFTNINQTISSIKIEAGSTHLGADGLGFFGNIWFYILSFSRFVGIEFLVPLILGTYLFIKKRKIEQLPVFTGFVFLVAISSLALHWERWGMPMFITPLVLGGIGLQAMVHGTKSHNLTLQQPRYSTPLKIFSWVVVAVVSVNLVSGAFAIVSQQLGVQTRIVALKYCNDNGITADQSIYEGYTPFLMQGPGLLYVNLDQEGNLVLPENKKNAKYIILSSQMYARFFAEPERYANDVAVYNKIRSSGKLIYEVKSQPSQFSYLGIKNLIYNLDKVLLTINGDVWGTTIQIYEITAT